MAAPLRIELFPANLDASVVFYVSVLDFEIVRDDRPGGGRYVWLRRDGVGLGLVERAPAEDKPPARPVAVEILVEVDDVTAERDRAVAAGGELTDDLVTRPWGLTDSRLVRPGRQLLASDGTAGARVRRPALPCTPYLGPRSPTRSRLSGSRRLDCG